MLAVSGAVERSDVFQPSLSNIRVSENTVHVETHCRAQVLVEWYGTAVADYVHDHDPFDMKQTKGTRHARRW